MLAHEPQVLTAYDLLIAWDRPKERLEVAGRIEALDRSSASQQGGGQIDAPESIAKTLVWACTHAAMGTVTIAVGVAAREIQTWPVYLHRVELIHAASQRGLITLLCSSGGG